MLNGMRWPTALCFRPRYRVLSPFYGPDGAVVELESCLLPSTGSYTLLLSVFSQVRTGSYEVEV